MKWLPIASLAADSDSDVPMEPYYTWLLANAPEQKPADTRVVPPLGLAVLATQRWPAGRTGRDSACLGVLVGLRASAGGVLDADARARPMPPRRRFWRTWPASVSSLATSKIFFMTAPGFIAPLPAPADPSSIEVHDGGKIRQCFGSLGPLWGLTVQAGIQGARTTE